MALVKDPVCGMRIEESDAVATVEHEGEIYHFCSEGCKESFEQDPDKYAKTD